MSEVKVNNTEGLTLKAGNTVETLAPKPVEAKDAPTPTPTKVETPKAQEAPKAAAPKVDPPKTPEAKSIAGQPVSREEFDLLVDAVYDLEQRLIKYNVGAPHKI